MFGNYLYDKIVEIAEYNVKIKTLFINEDVEFVDQLINPLN